jgi:hypothetical protein
MKTTTTTIILVCFFSLAILSCNSQHCLEHWETEKISSIQVDLKLPDGNTDKLLINDKSKIKHVMDFLLSTNFKPVKDGSLKKALNIDQWTFRLIFKGQRDQIFLFEDFAFIGKTTYLIDENVLDDFKKLIQ